MSFLARLNVIIRTGHTDPLVFLPDLKLGQRCMGHLSWSLFGAEEGKLPAWSSFTFGLCFFHLGLYISVFRPYKNTLLLYTSFVEERISVMNFWAQWSAAKVLYIWQLVWKKIPISAKI